MGKFRSKDPLAFPAGLWILAKGRKDGFHGKLNRVLADLHNNKRHLCGILAFHLSPSWEN